MISQSKLKEKLHYNQDTGVFIWIGTKSNIVKNGDIAGTPSGHGYLIVGIKNKKYYLHRLAWLYVYDEIPGDIDHINHNRSDNRICNLRNVTSKENSKNRSKQSNNKSGMVGVTWYKNYNKWRSYIKVDGKQISLGYFTQFYEAVNARKNAEVLYGFHKNHGRRR